jgi:hypothetical protein
MQDSRVASGWQCACSQIELTVIPQSSSLSANDAMQANQAKSAVAKWSLADGREWRTCCPSRPWRKLLFASSVKWMGHQR